MALVDFVKKRDRRAKQPDEKYVVCTICDISCQLRASVDEEGRLAKLRQHDNPAFAKAAARIKKAYDQALTDGAKTRDLGGELGTDAFADAVIARL